MLWILESEAVPLRLATTSTSLNTALSGEPVPALHRVMVWLVVVRVTVQVAMAKVVAVLAGQSVDRLRREGWRQ